MCVTGGPVIPRSSSSTFRLPEVRILFPNKPVAVQVCDNRRVVIDDRVVIGWLLGGWIVEELGAAQGVKSLGFLGTWPG